jgi:hypothetical protein
MRSPRPLTAAVRRMHKKLGWLVFGTLAARARVRVARARVLFLVRRLGHS